MKRNGFTMIEVIVALAIVGISLGVFISILGNSLRSRWKVEDHAKNLFAARVTAENFMLGLLESDEGETEDGVQWAVKSVKIKERKKSEDEPGSIFGDDDSDVIFGDEEDASKKIEFYNVIVGGVEVSSSKGAKK